MPQPLDYASVGRTIAEGEYRYRTGNVITSMIFALLFAGISFWFWRRHPDSWMITVPFMFLTIGLAILVAAWYALDYRLRYTIGSNGIVTQKRFFGWREIQRVYASVRQTDQGCQLAFDLTPDGTLLRKLPRVLTQEPRLSRDDCEAIFERLRDEVQPLHPHLEIGAFIDEPPE